MGIDKEADGSFTVTITTVADRKAAEECDRAISEYMHEMIGDRDGGSLTMATAELMHDKIDASAQAVIDAVNEARRECHRQLNEQTRYLRACRCDEDSSHADRLLRALRRRHT